MRKLLKDRHATLIVLSFIIGSLASVANIAFRETLHFIHDTILVGGSELLGIAEGGSSRLLLPLLPMTGMLLLIPFALKFPDEASGYGFFRFLESVNVKGGKVKLRNIFLKIIGPALTIGSGGSAGVEGPIATVGGTIGSNIGQAFKVSGNRMKLLVAAGSAGAIAATFNAPIAGVMFAMEIILLGNYELTSFAAIVISSGIATVISRAYYGASPAFTVPSYELVSSYEILFYIVLGIIVGFLAVLYIKMFYRIKDYFVSLRFSLPFKMLAGAFMVGLIGIFLPQVMADGYSIIEQALDGQIAFHILFLLVFFKMLATSLTLGSGGTGGVFAPAIFIGAMIGGAFGSIVHTAFPEITASSGAYATVGIGSFLAAATHAPLTGIFLLFEMTGNHEVIVPVMFSSIIGTVLAKRLFHDSIDTVELTRKGINIHAGREISLMSNIKVNDVMVRDIVTVKEDVPLSTLVNIMINRERFYIPVVNDSDRMTGILSIQDVSPVIFEDYVKNIVKAGELSTEDVITLLPEDNLNTAMESFTIKDIDEIPVIDSNENKKVVGMLRHMDVISAYKKAILKRERESKF